MSQAEALQAGHGRHGAGPVRARTALCGFGRTRTTWADVAAARGEPDVVATVGASASLIARGAGLSYGDAAQNDGGEVLDMSGMNQIVSIDRQRGLVTAQAGVTIGRLMAELAPHAMTIAVAPGTRHVTLGGALASDIHGKSHHCDGAIGAFVESLTLCTPADGMLELSPRNRPELFWATLGGMGLTGVICAATVRAQPLASPWVAADIDRTERFEQALELMSDHDRHRYSVAWLDLLATGPNAGRAVVSRADPLVESEPHRRRPGRKSVGGSLAKGPLVTVPPRCPHLLRPAAMRAFNSARWHASPRKAIAKRLALGSYLFPLDALGGWNRLYGGAGLIQYQFVVPIGREEILLRSLALLRERRLPVYLAVFKRMGAPSPGPLSFPLQGWTLALDLPAGADGLAGALVQLDELVAGCGGRVYLSKDARISPPMVEAMYPRLDEFRAQCAQADPDGVMRSDLAMRVGLCKARA